MVLGLFRVLRVFGGFCAFRVLGGFGLLGFWVVLGLSGFRVLGYGMFRAKDFLDLGFRVFGLGECVFGKTQLLDDKDCCKRVFGGLG